MIAMASEQKKTIADVSDIIKQAIAQAAVSKKRDDITTVEAMIPAMETRRLPEEL